MIFLKSLDNNEKGHFDAVAKTHSFCSLKWKKTNTNRQLKKKLIRFTNIRESYM